MNHVPYLCWNADVLGAPENKITVAGTIMVTVAISQRRSVIVIS